MYVPHAMRIPASWFGLLYYPSRCEKRLRLHFQGVPAEPPGPFGELLVELGRRHERQHLSTLPEFLDLSQGTRRERSERTLEELQRRRWVLYQPLLQTNIETVGTRHRLIGSPDFMLPTPDGWKIRDAKLAHNVEKPHILAQLNFYGLLYEQVQGKLPVALEVVLGTGEIVSTPYVGQEQVVNQIREVERSKLDLYLNRYGDRDTIAARVRANLLDLLRVMSRSLCLPLPTRSLKEVEKYVGFQRQLPGAGDWAISQYIRATEIGDPQAAQEVLDEILGYNQEDLEATWAVYRWLRDGVC